MSRFTSTYQTNRPVAQQPADRQALAVGVNTNAVSSPYVDDPGFLANAFNNSNPSGDSHDISFSGLPSLATLSETPTRIPSRVTTSLLGYNQSGREHSRQRISRWLVLVLPPSFITESQGVFGHTLSSGPSSRLSQGLLLPLYPTMYAQLGAIAREFNFPSIVGICLYMHVNEAGALFTPRISEESWGILWGHLFEPNAPGPTSGLPISGQIEFDIDVTKARWYESWISASRRETASLASPSPTHVASVHQRQESKTTVNFEDVQEQSQTIAGIRKRARYTPKRLSLVERFDLANASPPMSLSIPMQVPVATSVPMPGPRLASPPLVRMAVLSPIVQEEESLLSHKEEIDNRVKSWRASATFKTNLLVSTGQVSLDPVNMPNTLSLGDPVDEVDEVRSELNPEDYSWSITSAGPPSVLDSPTSASSHRVPSVHVDRRAIGSVPLTPETCTSWGPEDYDPLSPISLDFRLSSPDLGQRCLEYCPMTPTTATSWGPPSEYSASPPLEPQWAYHRPPSVDLGRRAEGSRPVTPSTATSWGPPEEWPPTPTTLSRVSTPDAAQQRFNFTEEIGGLVLRQRVMTPASPAPWNLVWPYLMPDGQTTKPQELAPRNSVRPYLTQAASPSGPSESRGPFVVVEHAAYPAIKIYPAVYPHFDIYPSVECDRVYRSYASSTVPETPAIQTQRRTLSTISLLFNTEFSFQPDRVGYPALNIYPAVYPYFKIYPRIQTVQSRTKVRSDDGGQEVKSYIHSGPKEVLRVQVWGFVWPLFRPVSSLASNTSPVSTSTSSPVPKPVMVYPTIKIYPAVYPFFDVYPVVERCAPAKPSKPVPHPKPSIVSKKLVDTRLGYPAVKIYEAVYPHFDIYPKVAQYVPKTTVSVRLPAAYPVFDIYPALYPHLNIYSPTTGVLQPAHPTPVVSMSNGMKTADVQLAPDYPSLVIYPSVYPWIDVYPSIAGESTKSMSPVPFRQSRSRLITHPRTKLRKRFTADEDAPPVPKLPDYATLQALSQIPSSLPQHGWKPSFRERLAYPVISIYHPVYPCFDIYPAVAGRNSLQSPREEQRSTTTSASSVLKLTPVSVKLRTSYPQLNIYPAVYPNFDIYPTIRGIVVNRRISVTSTPSVRVTNTFAPPYPVIEIYKPAYPYFDIYPSWSRTQGYSRREHNVRALDHGVLPGSTADTPAGTLLELIVVSKPPYPLIQIYHPVYPHFDIYPSWIHVQTMPTVRRITKIRKFHRELYEEVFATTPIHSPGSVPTFSSPRYPAYPALEIYKAAYPHFNVYPSWIQVLVPLPHDAPRQEARKSHKELRNEVTSRLPITAPDDLKDSTVKERVLRRPHVLTIITKQQEPAEEPPLSSVPKVSPLCRRIPSLNQLNGRNSSPSRPRGSPAFDSFPSIETRLSQSEDEAAEPLDMVPTTLTRPQSSSAQPTTPTRRQSALVAQRIKVLNATTESLEPVFDHPVRGSTRSLPISPTRA